MVLDDVVPGVARIVHDDVDGAESRQRGVNQLAWKPGVRDVARQGLGIASGLVDQHTGLEDRITVEIVQHYRGAGLSEFPRRRASDTTTGSGYQRGPALQVEKHVPVYSTPRGPVRRGTGILKPE